MGCFNVSCALSGLTIHAGNPCYFIPLIPDQYSKGRLPNDVLIVSNEGANAIFIPAFLPIKGEYNDYGRLENPEKNSNTELIEKTLNTTIEAFIDEPSEFKVSVEQFVLGNSVEEHHYEIVEVPLAGCFVHQFAYDTAYQHTLTKTNYLGGQSFATTFPVGNFLLEWLGLPKPTILENTKERYKYVYKIEGVDTHVIQSDGEFSHIAKVTQEGLKNVGSITNLHKFQKQWEKATGKPFTIPKEAYTIHSLNEDIDKARDILIKRQKAKANMTDAENTLKELEGKGNASEEDRQKLMSLIENLLYDTKYLGETTLFFRAFPCAPRYENLIAVDDPTIRKLFCELASLTRFMYFNSRMFMPTLSGPQSGDLQAEKALLEASIKFVNDRIKEYKEYESY